MHCMVGGNTDRKSHCANVVSSWELQITPGGGGGGGGGSHDDNSRKDKGLFPHPFQGSENACAGEKRRGERERKERLSKIDQIKPHI